MSEQPQSESVSTASILEQYERFVIGNYARTTLVVDRAEGSYFWDLKGRRILDLFPAWGCGAIGHCHPRVVNAVREQVGRLIHIDNTFYTVAQGRLAEIISRRIDRRGSVEYKREMARVLTARALTKAVERAGGN